MERSKECQELVKKTYAQPALKEMLQTRSTIIHVSHSSPTIVLDYLVILKHDFSKKKDDR